MILAPIESLIYHLSNNQYFYAQQIFLEHDTYKAWSKVTALPWPPRPSCRPSGVSVAHDCPAVGSPWTAELCNHNTPLPQHTFTTTHIYHNTPLPQHTFTTTHLYHNTRLPQHTFTTTHIYHNTPLPQLCGGSISTHVLKLHSEIVHLLHTNVP